MVIFHSYVKLMGKSTISMAIFHCFLYVHQRVTTNHSKKNPSPPLPWNLRCQVSTRCFHLAQALRHRGHLAARLDPLRGKQSRASATGVLDGKKLGKTWEKCVKTWQNHGNIRGNHRKIWGKHEICWVIAWDFKAFNGDRTGFISRYFLISKDLSY